MSEVVFRALKATEWEKAKGALRAVVAVQAHYRFGKDTEADRESESVRWEDLNDRTEAFITEIEEQGLHE